MDSIKYYKIQTFYVYVFVLRLPLFFFNLSIHCELSHHSTMFQIVLNSIHMGESFQYYSWFQDLSTESQPQYTELGRFLWLHWIISSLSKDNWQFKFKNENKKRAYFKF